MYVVSYVCIRYSTPLQPYVLASFPTYLPYSLFLLLLLLCRVIKVAKDFVDGVTFSVSSKEEYAHELKELGLEGDQEVMAALFDKEGKKYSMTDKFR